MRTRLLVALALLAVGLGVGGLLVASEDRLEPPRAPAPTWSMPPPTEGQSYALDAALRRRNLEAVGLTGARLTEALAAADATLARRSALEPALRALDPGLIRRTLCAAVEPALYRAAPLLLEGKDDATRVRDLVATASSLDPGLPGGPTPDEVRALYDTFERRRDGTTRPASHALLALAALTVGHAREATGDGRPDPWRAPSPSDDPLADVAKLWPRGVGQLPTFLGTAEALAELVNGSPGVYGCPGGAG